MDAKPNRQSCGEVMTDLIPARVEEGTTLSGDEIEEHKSSYRTYPFVAGGGGVSHAKMTEMVKRQEEALQKQSHE